MPRDQMLHRDPSILSFLSVSVSGPLLILGSVPGTLMSSGNSTVLRIGGFDWIGNFMDFRPWRRDLHRCAAGAEWHRLPLSKLT